MKVVKNMGTADRVFRLILSAVLIFVGVFQQDIIDNTLVNYILVFFGVANFIVSTIAFCPLYTLADMNTLGAKKE